MTYVLVECMFPLELKSQKYSTSIDIIFIYTNLDWKICQRQMGVRLIGFNFSGALFFIAHFRLEKSVLNVMFLNNIIRSTIKLFR